MFCLLINDKFYYSSDRQKSPSFCKPQIFFFRISAITIVMTAIPPDLPMYRPKSDSPNVPNSNSQPLARELGWGLELLFLVAISFLFLMGRTPAWKSLIDNISINFLAIIVEALPFMLIGSLAGGLIEVFVPIVLIDKVFGQKPVRAVFLAGGLGLAFPVCECAIIPVVRRLLGKGVPFPAAIAFLLAGPIVNIIVAWSTAVAYAYDWRVVLIRLACGYTIAVAVGLLLGLAFTRTNGLHQGLASLSETACCGHDHGSSKQALPARLSHALEHASDDFFAVGRYLVIGAFIAAIMRTSVSLDSFTSLMGTPWLAIVIMMIMAFVLNLCSEADAFIAASFRDLLPGSAQMAFMVLGPMLDIKLLLMYLSVFRKRAIVVLCLTVVAAVFLVMLAMEVFFPAFV